MTTRTTDAPAAYAVLFDSLGDDTYPTDFAAMADLSSLSSQEMSIISSMFGKTSTTSIKATSTVPPPPKPTPMADCDFWDESWGWTFEVYNINGWSADHGSSLHNQENGCGALTGWDWHDATSMSYAYTYFNLPFWIKDGCIERAIVSAGGPKISCKGHGLSGKKRSDANTKKSLEARAYIKAQAVRPSFSDEQVKEFESFYSENKTYHKYSPLN